MIDQKTAWSRRSFLQSALGTGAGFALTGPSPPSAPVPPAPPPAAMIRLRRAPPG